jgi:nicotinamidase/pyrazinamidase
MKALILIDLQNDFFPWGALPVKNGDKILPVIQSLLKLDWDLVIASKDWHPPGHGSFASTHKKKPGDKIVLDGLEQILWPDHCVQGTQGAEFAKGWQAENVNKIIYKGTNKEIDSYSAFYDNAHKRSTGLNDFLTEKKVNQVYLAGLATDYCVKYSTLDACSLGFDTFVIEDACKGVELREGDVAKAVAEMKDAGAVIIRSDSLFR